MGKMPRNSLGKSSELKLHCLCLIDAYSMPKDMCSVGIFPFLWKGLWPFLHNLEQAFFGVAGILVVIL